MVKNDLQRSSSDSIRYTVVVKKSKKFETRFITDYTHNEIAKRVNRSPLLTLYHEL
jgi:hypothetical protein